MNDQYPNTARSCWRSRRMRLPPHFAKRDGTAINMFVQGLPCRSVDIDVVTHAHGPDHRKELSMPS
jgi:hypothetical protein